MESPVQIKSALISVYYKDKLGYFAKYLHESGVTIYSTGGTGKFIEGLGIPVIAVEDLTGYPSILGGRVKTLHPKVFGGILSRRGNSFDTAELEKYSIPFFDLVVVDLYPFSETMNSGTADDEIIEKIDVGGVSLIRAAAKNFADVTVISDVNDLEKFQALIGSQSNTTTFEQRKQFAAKAFALTSEYDRNINGWFTANNSFHADYSPVVKMRYGENPHQQAKFYGKINDVFEQIHGKDLSFNNLVDIESAIYLIGEFADQPAFAVIKHTNSCGLATGKDLSEAWKKALAADPVSAFGGVLICNRKLDEATAVMVNELFFEVLAAPGFEGGALGILKTKKNRILLELKFPDLPPRQFRSLLNGVLVQERDMSLGTRDELICTTEKKPSETEYNDLLFAEKAVKHLKSNGIALVKHGQLLAAGMGQTSRVDALKQAISKARNFGFDLNGAVMASEAFFPFPDCVEIAKEAGITSVLEPGGSIRDQDSIDYCNKNNLSMVFTGLRHFKH